MRRRIRWWPGLAFVVGCGGTAGPASTPPPPASTAPVASIAPATPSASTPPPARVPEPISLDQDLVDDEPVLDAKRSKLVKELRRARYVVRGRVTEAKARREPRGGGAVTYSYAIIEIVEWLRGDPARVERGYQKSFAISSTPMPEGVSKSPVEHVRFIEEELGAQVGKERLFFVNLPSEDGKGWIEPGPPAFIMKRWGKYHVGVVDHLGVDERDDVTGAVDDLTKHDAWVTANAKRLVVGDKFGAAATSDAAAKAVLAFVIGDLGAHGVAVTGELAPPSEERGVVRYQSTLVGAGEPANVSIQIDAATHRVRSFRVDAELAKRHMAAKARFARDRVLEDTRRRLGLTARGGKLFTHTALATRGDGLSFVDVTLHAGTVERGGSSHPSRATHVALSSDEAIVFEYTNGWAE